MANPLTDLETEAISMLQAGNPNAFDIMIRYFERMYEYEAKSCVECNLTSVEIHRGRARAFSDAMGIHIDATNKLNSK